MPRFQDVTIAGTLSLSATSQTLPTVFTGNVNNVRYVRAGGAFETIQPAIDDLTTGGVVIASTATYALGSTGLTIPEGVCLTGMGSDGTIGTGAFSEGTILTYTGTGDAITFAGGGNCLESLSVDINGAGASARAIAWGAQSTGKIDRIKVRVLNSTTQRALFMGATAGSAGQHNSVNNFYTNGGVVEVTGNGSNRATTVIFSNVHAHSYIVNIAAAFHAIDCTAEGTPNPTDRIDLDDVNTFTWIGGDIEDGGTNAFNLSSVTSFHVPNVNLGGFTGTNNITGSPTRGYFNGNGVANPLLWGTWRFDVNNQGLVGVATGGSEIPIVKVDASDRISVGNSSTPTIIEGTSRIEGDIDHNGTNVGFYSSAGVAQAAASANLTDNSGGSADDTIASITNANNAGSSDVVPTQNAIADIAAKVNNILTALRNLGLIAT